MTTKERYNHLLEMHTRNIIQKADVMHEMDNLITLLESIHNGETIPPALLVNQIDTARATLQKATR